MCKEEFAKNEFSRITTKDWKEGCVNLKKAEEKYLDNELFPDDYGGVEYPYNKRRRKYKLYSRQNLSCKSCKSTLENRCDQKSIIMTYIIDRPAEALASGPRSCEHISIWRDI